jgi:hypothetical protein
LERDDKTGGRGSKGREMEHDQEQKQKQNEIELQVVLKGNQQEQMLGSRKRRDSQDN